MAQKILDLPPLSAAMSQGYQRMALTPKHDPLYKTQVIPWPTWAAVFGAGLMTRIPAINQETGADPTTASIKTHWRWTKSRFRGALPCGCPRTYKPPFDNRDWADNDRALRDFLPGDDSALTRMIRKYYTPTFVDVIVHLYRHHYCSDRNASWSTDQIVEWVQSVEPTAEKRKRRKAGVTQARFTNDDLIRARGMGVFLSF